MLEEAKRDCRDEREYKNIQSVIDSKNEKMEFYKENLKKLSDNQICYRIYEKMLNGINPTKAVEQVAEENYLAGVIPCSIPTIWNFYKKLKKILKL